MCDAVAATLHGERMKELESACSRQTHGAAGVRQRLRIINGVKMFRLFQFCSRNINLNLCMHISSQIAQFSCVRTHTMNDDELLIIFHVSVKLLVCFNRRLASNHIDDKEKYVRAFIFITLLMRIDRGCSNQITSSTKGSRSPASYAQNNVSHI